MKYTFARKIQPCSHRLTLGWEESGLGLWPGSEAGRRVVLDCGLGPRLGGEWSWTVAWVRGWEENGLGLWPGSEAGRRMVLDCGVEWSPVLTLLAAEIFLLKKHVKPSVPGDSFNCAIGIFLLIDSTRKPFNEGEMCSSLLFMFSPFSLFLLPLIDSTL